MNAIVLHRIADINLPHSHRSQSIHEHDEIADAIIGRDRPRAAALMREHHDAFLAYLRTDVPLFLRAPIDWRSM
jgi:DNA-binding GntR family transcriptional regulator